MDDRRVTRRAIRRQIAETGRRGSNIPPEGRWRKYDYVIVGPNAFTRPVARPSATV